MTNLRKQNPGNKPASIADRKLMRNVNIMLSLIRCRRSRSILPHLVLVSTKPCQIYPVLVAEAKWSHSVTL
jgi:hypothetical protein